MKAWKEMLLLLITLSPAIGACILYNQLPDVMATHFGLHNEVNGTMSKGIAILMLTVLGLIPLVMSIMRTMDPKKTNYEKFIVAFEVKRLGVSLLLAVVGWAVVGYNLGHHWNIQKLVMIVIGALFIVAGNFLTQVRHNYTFGVRTPWTLANEEVWFKTHRLAGPLMMIGGAVGIASAFMNSQAAIVVFLSAIILASFIPVVYSYILFTRIKGH